jgi:antitoxin ParD1/3/4
MEVAIVSTRNVVLSQHQHELVESLVVAGRYQNASEVLRAGLRLLEQQELEDSSKLQALREAAEQFGADARERYATLIVTVIRNAASSRATDDRSARPELGGMFSLGT